MQRSKLRIHTRLQLLAKWNPKKYGEKLALEHSGKVATGLEMDADHARRVAEQILRGMAPADPQMTPTTGGPQ